VAIVAPDRRALALGPRDKVFEDGSELVPATSSIMADAPWQSVVQVVHPIVTTGRVRGARERASRIPDSLAVPF
jgi:hypothetical protein